MNTKIKEKFNKFIDVLTYKEQIKLLERRIKDLEKEKQPLIDKKNKYLTELRVKNLELGKLKKRIEELESTLDGIYGWWEDLR